MREIDFADAQQALGFLQPQLLRIEAEVYETKYPSFDYASLMFVDTAGDMWEVGSLSYRSDIAGEAKFIAGAGFDVPYASTDRDQFLTANHFAAIGYEWNMQEMQRAEKLGRNLGSDKAASARKVAESFIYGIAVRGAVEKNLTGLVNDANVPTANVAATGTQNGATGSTLWANKTPVQILVDVNEVLNAPLIATGESQIANTLLLPTSRMQYLSQTQLSSGVVDTLLKYIRDNNYFTLTTGQPLTIKATRELEAAGASGAARMMAYDNSPETVRFRLPGPHTFLPPHQKSSMTFEVAGIMNIGGTEIRLPKAVAYRDGV